jgi:hypothetical protein
MKPTKQELAALIIIRDELIKRKEASYMDELSTYHPYIEITLDPLLKERILKQKAEYRKKQSALFQKIKKIEYIIDKNI